MILKVEFFQKPLRIHRKPMLYEDYTCQKVKMRWDVSLTWILTLVLPTPLEFHEKVALRAFDFCNYTIFSYRC